MARKRATTKAGGMLLGNEAQDRGASQTLADERPAQVTGWTVAGLSNDLELRYLLVIAAMFTTDLLIQPANLLMGAFVIALQVLFLKILGKRWKIDAADEMIDEIKGKFITKRKSETK